MATKQSASSPRGKRIAANVLFTKPLSERQRKELAQLARMPDSQIDYSDAPALKGTPAKVYVGRFYRPVKQQISIRVDADVLAWFRSKGKYQTLINQVLRREMQNGGSAH